MYNLENNVSAQYIYIEVIGLGGSHTFKVRIMTDIME